MSRPDPGAGAGRRLPFVLPTGTFAAFLLLISLVFTVVTVWRPAVFGLVLADRPAPARADYARCHAATYAVPGEISKASPDCASILDAAHTDQRPSILLAFGVLGLLTLVQYGFGPARRIRRQRLRPLDRGALPVLGDELDRLTSLTLAKGRVRFLVDLVNPAVDGLAFGRVGRRSVVLSRGLLDLFARDPSTFRAVVLHELAHVRNRDLDITAVTLALWRSFLAVVLLPGLGGAALGIALGTGPTRGELRGDPEAFVSGPGLSWVLAAQFVGLAGLAWLTRLIVLETRELHADARMMSWHPEPAALRALFRTVAQRRWSMTALRRRTHPHLATRVAALTDPGLLMRQGFAFSFALGACFALSMDAATSFTATVRTDPFYWPAELFVLVLTVAFGISALRAAVADTETRTGTGTVVGGRRARLGLALGMPVGWALAPSRMSDHTIAPFPVVLQLPALLLLLAAGWLFGLWVQWVMARWAPAVRAAVRPARAALVPVTLVVLLAVLYARPVYEVQSGVIVSYLIRQPAVSDPTVFVLLVAQRVLDGLLVGRSVVGGVPGWFPIGLVVLAVPLFHRTRPAAVVDGGVPQRRRHVVPAGILAGTVVGLLAFAGWAAADGPLLGIRFPSPDVGAVVCALAAGSAAAVAVWARTRPVAGALLAGLVVGSAAVGVLSAFRTPAVYQTLVLGRTLESAVLAGLVVAGLRALVAGASVRRGPAADRPTVSSGDAAEVGQRTPRRA